MESKDVFPRLRTAGQKRYPKTAQVQLKVVKRCFWYDTSKYLKDPLILDMKVVLCYD